MYSDAYCKQKSSYTYHTVQNNFFFKHGKLKLSSKVETKCNISVHVIRIQYQIIYIFHTHTFKVLHI